MTIQENPNRGLEDLCDNLQNHKAQAGSLTKAKDKTGVAGRDDSSLQDEGRVRSLLKPARLGGVIAGMLPA